MTDPRDHHASLQFEYDDPRRARAVSEAVRVECGEIQRETGSNERSATSVERRGRVVEIDLIARDLVALRAGLNTWTRLVEVAEQTAEMA